MTPGQKRARLHNRTWFTRDGRALRSMARATLETLRGSGRPAGAGRWTAWAAQSRGGLIAILEALAEQQRAMEAHAQRALAPSRGRAAPTDAAALPEPPAPTQAPPEPDSAEPSPVADPTPRNRMAELRARLGPPTRAGFSIEQDGE